MVGAQQHQEDHRGGLGGAQADLSIRPFQRMPPLMTASTPQAAAPIAAASVGLAQPP